MTDNSCLNAQEYDALDTESIALLMRYVGIYIHKCFETQHECQITYGYRFRFKCLNCSGE